MMTKQTTSSSPAQVLIALVRSTVARRRIITVLMTIAFAVALTALALVFADALLSLPPALRIPALPLWLAGGAAAIVMLALVARSFIPSVATAAQLAEDFSADQRRTLSTALALETMPGELAAAGVRRLAAELQPDRWMQHLPRSQAQRWLVALVALALVAGVVHVVVPTMFGAVLPRFTDPRGDHPPFSLSSVTWATAPIRVRSGDAARFEAAISGPGAAQGLELHARPVSGGDEQSLTMFQVGTGRYAGELAGVTGPLDVWAAGGGTRTHYHRLDVDMVPVLTRLEVGIEAPRYARLDPERRRLRAGELGEFAALPGSRLVLTPSANRSLAAVLVAHDGGAALRLPLVNGAVTIADLTQGIWSLSLEASDGIRNDAQPILRITARTDEPPRARIVQPGNDALATPGMTVPLTIEADDDLGLENVARVSEYNQLPAPELSEVVTDRRYRRASQLHLPTVGVAPGDVITIHAIARDSRPDPQFSPSDSRHIRIISEEEYNRMLMKRIRPDALERKYQPFTHDLAELEEAMKELRRSTPAKDELDRQLAELAKKAGELKRKIRALKRETPLFASEPQLQEMLSQAAEELEKSAQEGKPSAREDGKRLASDLALLTRLARAQGFTARLRQLIDAEQNATERLAPLAEHRRLSDSDRVRLRELGGQEDTLAQALTEWSELAPKLADDLRYGPWAKSDQPKNSAAASESADLLDGLGQAVTATGAADLKRQAANAARSGDGVEAQRLAALARDRLMELLPKSLNMAGSCSGEACMRLRWGNCSGLAKTLGGLGGAAGNGYGVGGAGSAGMGLFLGYGGDDLGGSLPSDSMDLFGPENFGDVSGQSGDSKDGIAAIAAAGSGEVRQATTYQRQQRASTATQRSSLSAEQQRLVDDYFRRLEGKKP